MRAQEVVDYIFEIAPQPSHAWENVFLLGDGDTETRGVAVAWWITSDILGDMIERGLTLGISHERVIYELPERFVWGDLPASREDVPANRRFIDRARAGGVAIHQMHSNIDKAEWGMPRALFDTLGWSGYNIDWSVGVPVVRIPPKRLIDLVAEIKEKLDIPFVRYDGDPERVVSRVGVPWGGLCQGFAGAICPAMLGVDVVIGGDIIDGVVRLARADGFAVIDAMHHATEMDAMRVLACKLAERFGDLPVEFYDNDPPWKVA